MKKKLISIFVAAMMIISIVPAAAFAGEAAREPASATGVEKASSPATEKAIAYWNFETDPIEQGWQFFDEDGDGHNWSWSGEFAHGGSYSIMSESYHGVPYDPDNWAISPEFTVPEGGAEATFFVKNFNDYYPENYSVCVMHTVDEHSFIDEILDQSASGDDWNEKSYDLSDYAGKTVNLAIRHFDSADRWKFYIDDVRIDVPHEPNVIYDADVSGFPRNIFDGMTPAEFADVLHIADGVDYVLEHTEFTDVNSTIIPSDTPLTAGETYVLTAFLFPAQDMSFALDAELTANGGGMQTEPSFTYVYEGEWARIGVMYECKPAPDLLWDFETDPNEQGFAFLNEDGDGYNWYWHVNTETGDNYHNAHSGDGVAASASYNIDTGAALSPDNWMITPEFTGTWLTFWMVAQDSGYSDDYIGVYVSTDGGETWSDEIFGRVTPDIYEQFEIDLSDYAGQPIRVAFRHYDSRDMFAAIIDDIEVGGSSVQPPEEPIVIDTVEILDFVAPAWGESPNYTVNVPEGAHYSVVSTVWNYYVNGLGFPQTMTPEMTFSNPNDTYYMIINIVADEGYAFKTSTFNPNNGDGNGGVNIIFDARGGHWFHSETQLEVFTKYFTVSEPIVIDTVEILDFVAPTWGEAPFYGVTVPEGARYSVANVEWNYRYTSGTATMTPEMIFDNPNYEYFMSVYLRADEGCTFDRSGGINIIFDGFSSIRFLSDTECCVSTYDFTVEEPAPEPIVINTVEILGFVAPAWGEAPFYGVTVPEGANYSVANVEWCYSYSEGGVSGTDTMPPEMIFDNPNYMYYMVVSFRADEGCTFDRSGGVTLIFDEFGGYGFDSDTEYWVMTRRFTVEEPAPEPIVIDTVEILGFVAPAWGEAPFYDVTVPEGAHYSIVDVKWRFFFTDEYGVYQMARMTPEMIFDNPNYEYFMSVYLRADEGCMFDSSDAFTVIFNEYEGSGVAAGTDCYASTYKFTVEEPAPEPIIIDTIEILDFVAPEWSENPFFDETVPEGACYFINGGDWCWWNDMLLEGGIMAPTDAFDRDDYIYYRVYSIVPAEGYAFSDEPTVTINGGTDLIDFCGWDEEMGCFYVRTIDFTVEEPVSTIFGDLDGDGEVTAADALLAIRYVMELGELDDEQLARADVNGDGEVTMMDCLLIQRYAMGIIENFPV